MRCMPQCARAVLKEGGAGGQTTAAIGGHPADSLNRPINPLTIPSCMSVPAAMASRGVDQRWANLALLCLDAGMLTDEMPVDKALNLVQKAFQGWLSAQLSDLKCLDRFDMHVASDISEVYEFQQKSDEFVVVCSPDTPEREFFIGERIAGLEEMVPGLGQTVLAAVQFASARTFPLWAPDSIMDEAANFYWSGATTMDEWLEEMEINYGVEGDGW